MLQEKHKISRKCIIQNSKGNKQNQFFFLQYAPWESLLRVEFLKYLMKHSEYAECHRKKLSLHFWVNELLKWKMGQLSREMAPLWKESKYSEKVFFLEVSVYCLIVRLCNSRFFLPSSGECRSDFKSCCLLNILVYCCAGCDDIPWSNQF